MSQPGSAQQLPLCIKAVQGPERWPVCACGAARRHAWITDRHMHPHGQCGELRPSDAPQPPPFHVTAARKCAVLPAMRRAAPRALPLDEVLASIASAQPVPRTTVAALIAHLRASSVARALSLYTSSSTAPTRAGLGWRVDVELSVDAARVRIAKQAVNAVLSALGGARSAAPSGALDCFRIGMAVLCCAGVDAAQLAPVALSIVHKLHTAGHHSEALTELVALQACLGEALDQGPATVLAPGDAVQRMTTAATYKDTLAPAHLVLEVQACAVQAGLALAPAAAAAPLARWLADERGGPGPWHAAARPEHAREADRAAYAIERAVFQFFARVRAPSSRAVWDARVATLVLLAPVHGLDMDAFWDRVLRVAAMHMRGGASSAAQDVGRGLARLAAVAAPHGAAFARLQQWADVHGCGGSLEARGPGAADVLHCPATPPQTGDSCVLAPATPPPQTGEPRASAPRTPVALSADPHTEPLTVQDSQDATDAAIRALQHAPPAAAAAALRAAPCLTHALRAALLTALDAGSGTASLSALDSAPLLAAALERAAGADEALAAHATHAARTWASSVFDESRVATLDSTCDVLRAAAALPYARPRHHAAQVLFHFGARLYAAQQYGHAVRFLVPACDMADARDTAALARRCQVLAGAYQHMGQYAAAHEAFWRGVAVQSAALDAAGAEAAHAAVERVFATGAGAPVAALLRGTLHVGVFGLLHAQRADASTSLASHVAQLPLTRAAQGAALEYAALTLVPMLACEDAPAALADLVDAALTCMPRSVYPVRRARLCLLQREVRVLAGAGGDEARAEVDACLAAPLGDDEGLAATRHELRAAQAAIDVWAAVRLGDVSAAEEAARHVCEALPCSAERSDSASSRRAPRSARASRSDAQALRKAALQTPPRAAARPPAPVSAAPRLGLLLLSAAEALRSVGATLHALRVLCAAEAHAPGEACVAAAEVWLSLGAADAADAALGAADAAYWDAAPSDLHARRHLAMAHAHALRGDVDAAHAAHAAAHLHARGERAGPAWDRVAARGAHWEVGARAAEAAAALALARGDVGRAQAAALEALRTRLRTAAVLAQAAAAAAPSDEGDSALEAPPRHVGAPLAPLALAALQWRTARALHDAYLALAALYVRRGAVRDADALARECAVLAERRGAARLHADALAWRAALLAASGMPSDAEAAAARALHDTHGACFGAAARLALLAGAPDEAEALVRDGAAALAHGVCHVDTTRAAPVCLPGLVAEAVRARVAALCETGAFAAAAAAAASLASAAPTTAAVLYAQTQLAAAHASGVGDTLAEVAWALPGAAPRAAARRALPLQAEAAMHMRPRLFDARRAAADALADGAADVRDVRAALEILRDAELALAGCPAVPAERAARRKGTPRTAERASAPPLSRELAARACALTAAAASVSVRRAIADAAARRAAPRINVWEDAAPSAACEAALSHAPPSVPRLAPGTAAVVLSLSRSRHELLLARYDHELAPAFFTLPLARQRARDGDDEPLTVDVALGALRTIVHTSNADVQGAKDVTSLDARKAWWTARRNYDAELAALLAAVQETWLGAFAGLLGTLPSDAQLGTLGAAAERLVRRACFGARRTPVALPPRATACLAALASPACRDEDLEDWVHYVMDALQLAGTPVAQDEVDVDELIVDLRGALDEFHARHVSADGHVFLVLDRELAELPWESLPILRHQSVSRLAALDDAYMRADGADSDAAPTLDAARTAYLLNPSGDLARSETRFAAALRAQHQWRGTIGRPPVLDEVATALATHDTFLYVGHQGAEMYMHPTRVRELPRCAATMLWGCSSGAIRTHGSFDASSTPLHYAVARCPALVASLWDTTDRELDSVCEAVLEQVGLLGAGRTSLPRAVATAREKCRLPYLTGAAVIVYGVPVQWAPM